MKRLKYFMWIGLCVLTLTNSSIVAQTAIGKPPLTLSDFKNWTTIGSHGINATGTYVYYFVNNKDAGTNILHLHSVHTGKEKTFNEAKSVRFSGDGNLLMFLTPNEKLILYHLSSNSVDSVVNVKEYFVINRNGKEMIAFHHSVKMALVVLDPKSCREILELQCLNYTFTPDFRNVILMRNSFNDPKSQMMVIYNITSQKGTKIWEGKNANGIVFDKILSKFCFSVNKDTGGNKENSVWLYKFGQKSAVKILNNQDTSLSKYILGSVDHFTAEGKSIVFYFKRLRRISNNVKVKASVDVYSFTDQIPYSEQSAFDKGSEEREFKGIFNIEEGRIIYLQNERDSELTSLGKNSAYYMLIVRDIEGENKYLNKNRHDFLISTVNGEHFKIEKNVSVQAGASPNGQYLLLTDEINSGEFYSYEFKSGVIRPLTATLPVPLKDPNFVTKRDQRKFMFSFWDEKTGKAVVRDNYDLWAIDLAGKETPINLTQGLGRSNQITFTISDLSLDNHFDNYISKYKHSRNIFLNSYNYNTGDNDFYTLNIEKKTLPKRLTEGGFAYEFMDYNNDGAVPVGGSSNSKAAKANVFLIQRTNVKELNLYTTSDFKIFKPISNSSREKQYNWYTSELVKFSGLDGTKIQGALYKPENFDPNKKYPVIFFFYTNFSGRLHKYLQPGLSGAAIDIPYYVSNGYLVFAPDIIPEYGSGVALSNALNSVLGAANYSSKLQYVDSTKLAIIGHSWGGIESGYIVTHTDKFAAAVVASGTSDVVGGWGVPGLDGGLIASFKISYDYVNGTIHDHLSTFVNNSPKLLANQVTTPVLFMHNKNDTAVPFRHGIGFFYSLWKLQKKAWLLQYDRGGHTITNKDDQLDYTIRLKQFFDHYLKDKPAPRWMTRGVPASLKGYEDGLDIDEKIKTPDTGSLINLK